MPRRIIENALAKYNQSNPIKVYGDNTITSKDKAVIRRMAAYIGVSYTASDNHINAMDMNKDYGDGANPVILKSEFIMSLCEQLIGGTNLGAKQKSIIDRCTASVYRSYQQNDYLFVLLFQAFRCKYLYLAIKAKHPTEKSRTG